jgi:type II secretory pathway pseudopilin PulG
MSEQEEIREAAAVGAAAAVDAIVGEQDEQAREQAVESAAQVAGMSAEQAAQEAEQATAAATAALAATAEAHAEASEAEATAQEAAAEATEARDEVGELREHIAAGFREMRDFITSSLGPKEPSSEPTEVVVTNATNRENPEQKGADTGSGESASGNEQPYRHRFGRSRG